jgi:hypothetical protein
MKLTQWWEGAGKGKRAVFLIVVVLVLLAVGNAVAAHVHHSSPGGGGSGSGFTASCAIVPILGPGTFTLGEAPVITFNNATPNVESVQGVLMTVIFFDQSGGQIGTGTVQAPAAIAAGQAVTTATGASFHDAPAGAETCSVAPYSISP